ncbi:MAG: metallophosphoesterase family protein [Thermoanaerobaculia bacterium]
MRVAVLSDIHGNAWALDAVLAEVDRAEVAHVLNLGDCFYGPLAPGATYERLRSFEWPTVRGNQDRVLIDGTAEGPTGRFTLREIGEEGVAWLAESTAPRVQLRGILACHGDLEHDDVPLIERIEPAGVRSATGAELTESLAGAAPDTEVVLCGHSHQPAMLQLPDGRLVVNPGSVGFPAYRDEEPHPHGMESGTPHARWAVLERVEAGWRVELRATPYDVEPAVAAARANGRPDWAGWIATGRAASPHRDP